MLKVVSALNEGAAIRPIVQVNTFEPVKPLIHVSMQDLPQAPMQPYYGVMAAVMQNVITRVRRD